MRRHGRAHRHDSQPRRDARPASGAPGKTASSFTSKVYIEKDNERVNGKSIMGVITLGATFNTPLKIIAEGPDEAQAVDAIRKAVRKPFRRGVGSGLSSRSSSVSQRAPPRMRRQFTASSPPPARQRRPRLPMGQTRGSRGLPPERPGVKDRIHRTALREGPGRLSVQR